MPLSQIISDNKKSFICCGFNNEETRKIKQDKFRVCWKNEEIDECSDWDEHDIYDTISVLAKALSISGHLKNS